MADTELPFVIGFNRLYDIATAERTGFDRQQIDKVVVYAAVLCKRECLDDFHWHCHTICPIMVITDPKRDGIAIEQMRFPGKKMDIGKWIVARRPAGCFFFYFEFNVEQGDRSDPVFCLVFIYSNVDPKIFLPKHRIVWMPVCGRLASHITL